ncbi:hypothetical protein Tsubulata_033214 [Turnera subulata]|uniref:HMA domain-containing protein n=1 Tax=Turnera subulata TaxID=218843 RepID=A0A9Q0J392_9ROSI|nr:hypothetical protein Tsubulata_033214 [Turnera subulata]
MSMTITPSVEEASKALKCQTWILKVSIHCQGCKKEVKKVLQRIDGVYTTTIDPQLQRVTVTGNIGAETLIKKLSKTGKHAELWPEKLSTKEKAAGKGNNMHKAEDPNSVQKRCHDGMKKFGGEGGLSEEEAKNHCNTQEKSTGEELHAEVNKVTETEGSEGAKSDGKKKKNKGKNASKVSQGTSGSGLGSPSNSGTTVETGYYNQFVSPSNLNLTRQHSVPLPQGFHIPSVSHASSYNYMAYPRESTAPFYHVPPPYPYVHPNTQQATTLDSFHIFRDDNVDGCSIM